MTYEGWANYPTWNVALWLNNDEIWQSDAREHVGLHLAGRHAPWCGDLDDHDVKDPAYLTSLHAEPLAFSEDWMRPFVVGILEQSFMGWPAAGIADDLIGWALEQVHWSEVAAAFAEDES
jgi:hypothetical protein